jgi:hypothetical protein
MEPPGDLHTMVEADFNEKIKQLVKPHSRRQLEAKARQLMPNRALHLSGNQSTLQPSSTWLTLLNSSFQSAASELGP